MPKSLLVIDPVANNRIKLGAVLEDAQYNVATVASVDEAFATVRDPDLVVLGIHSEQPALALAKLDALCLTAQTPVLCIDANPSPLRRLMAMRAGARDVLPRTVPDELLKARLRGLIREGEAQRECERRRVTAASFGFSEAAPGFSAQARIACVGELGSLPNLPSVLSSTLPHSVSTLSVEDVLRDEGEVPTSDAYVILSGQNYRAVDALLPELRDRSHLRHAPVLVLYPNDRADIGTRALALGASDIAAENASGEELALRVEAMLDRSRLREALRRSDEQSYRLAVTDPLTGLYNRRYAEAYLGDLVMRQSETDAGYVLMIVDLDHFKSVNDRYGHPAGDHVLCEVAHRLRDNLRACDLVSRHGGEEFLVILPDTNPDEAARTAERLRAAVAVNPVRLASGVLVEVTASIGVATADPSASEPVETYRTGTFDVATPQTASSLMRIFDAADAALYRAKEFGRNRIEFSDA